MGAPASNTWAAYWEEMEDKQRVFRIEARDYASRVRASLLPRSDFCVLDFGCGFGHTARELAADVSRIKLWDASSHVRRQARDRIADVPNAELLDVDTLNPDALAGWFDLILVHSVIQYMSQEEIGAWLARWHSMLKRDGRLVLSDLIVPGAGGLHELLSYLGFALRNGFFWNAFISGVTETAHYLKARRSRPLTSVTRSTMEHWAAAAGFSTEWLDQNLSHRQTRATVILKRA
jgi:cyclopropane fatty-acyl-phospholipid synthase-like methyltransferase